MWSRLAAGRWGCGASPAGSLMVRDPIRNGIPPGPADCQAASSAVELGSSTKVLVCSLSAISLEAALGVFALLANPGSRH